MAKKLLIVDDELPLLRNLSRYLSSFDDRFEVMTAPSAEEALDIIRADGLDILLTDVRLPGLGGIELVQQAVALNPALRVLVMTAYPTRYVREGAMSAGALHFLEKPLDLKELQELLAQVAATPAGWSGSVGGLDIFDFIQLFSMSGKTTAIEVSFGARKGFLVFDEGRLVHASSGDLQGERAFFFMTSWQGGTFRELPRNAWKRSKRNINSTTNNLMMEAARLLDEARKAGKEGSANEAEGGLVPEDGPERSTVKPTQAPETGKEEMEMAIKDHLEAFEEIQGFQGVAVFTAQGEMMEGIAKGKMDIKSVGMFANNALLNAQKATDQMGVGRGNLMQIRAPQATVLMRCLNEATDFAATKEGKAHFHTVVVMDPEGNAGMAAMLLDRAVGKIAEELR